MLDAAPIAVDASAAPADAALVPLTLAIPTGQVGVQILDLQYGGVASPGLPAMRADGKQIAAIAVADDGGRGYLALSLRIIDADTAAVVKEWVLADPDQTTAAEADTDSGVTAAVAGAVRAQVAEANAALAAETWRALAPVVPKEPETDSTVPLTITVGAVGFTYVQGRLTVVGPGTKPLERRYDQLTGQDLPNRKRKPKENDAESCRDLREYLQSVAIDDASQRALITFGFTSGHNCGAPGPVFGTLALP